MKYYAVNGGERWIDKEKQFYLFNHIAILGLDRGSRQVARRLEMQQYEVLTIFYQLHRKAKAHQMAV
ncbi:hypothetical protein [Halalkalibacter oceani]|uniref:hypothetical protein n=1 Tax=Halalkalibacter oceani TaxID=1653776 RepID=UPI003398D59A